MHMPNQSTVISNRCNVTTTALCCVRSRQKARNRRLTATSLVWVAAKLSAGQSGSRVIRGAVGHVSRFQRECKQPHRQMTSCLVAVNCGMHAAQGFSKHALTQWGVKSNGEIASGQLWRLMTPALLHLNLVHLGANSLGLNSVGPLLERESGAQRFLAVYLISAVSSIAASCMQPNPSVGSSGAVFGVAGALAMFHYTHKHILEQNNMGLPTPVGERMLWCLHHNLVVNLKAGLVCPYVDMWGHMGGLAGGALTAYLLGPRLVNTGPRACKKAFVDCPPVRWFARKDVIRYEGVKCCCMRCSLDGAGIQMRPKQKRKLKFSNRLQVIQHCNFA